jgi:uncharacterized glyoxalase superfamily protein PhnB
MFKSEILLKEIGLLIISVSLFAQNNSNLNKLTESSLVKDSVMPQIILRPEHIAFNVEDPVAQTKWFVDNMEFKVMYKGDPPNNTRFIADAGENMMMELYNNKEYPKLDLLKISHMTIHFAFMVDSMEAVKAKLITAGATLVEDITKTASGDLVLMLRDPWDLPIQFVQRAKPMLKYSAFRPEHFAMNISDPVGKAKWLVENLRMKIIRQGSAPTYTTFIADENENMMLELFYNENYPLMDFKNTNYMALHFAFMVNDVEAIKSKLIAAGATVLEDIKKTATGTIVLVLKDPWDQALQFIKRVEPMLK